jgi:hypothetical protein
MSKELKLEPEPVLKLSETKRLVLVDLQNTETARFGVSVEPKLTNLNVSSVFTMFCFVLLGFAFICLVIFILARFLFVSFHLVSLQDPKQFFFSQNKPKQHGNSLVFQFVLVQTETNKSVSQDTLGVVNIQEAILSKSK